MLDNRLQSIFVCKSVVNMSRRNLRDFEISLLPKGLNFVSTSNTIDKAKLKNKIRGTLWNITIKVEKRCKLIWPVLVQAKGLSTAIKIYMSGLEKKFKKNKIPKDKYKPYTIWKTIQILLLKALIRNLQ